MLKAALCVVAALLYAAVALMCWFVLYAVNYNPFKRGMSESPDARAGVTPLQSMWWGLFWPLTCAVFFKRFVWKVLR